MLSSVTSDEDNSVSYSIYIPKTYSEGKKTPAIFFFDPHADGALPLSLYDSLAENFNFILVGSNNSKNGIDMQSATKIANTMIRDVSQKLSIDEKRMYTCGFSGGAGVASGLATQFADVAGVIACSGGGVEPSQSFPATFCFVGLAGLSDFNYHHLVEASNHIAYANFAHEFLTDDYKHEWAPARLMNKAFEFIELKAVKNKLSENNPLGEKVKLEFEKELQKSKNDIYICWQLNKHAVNFLSGLTDISAFQKEVDRLQVSKELKDIFKEQQKIDEIEKTQQQVYQQNFQAQDINWWEKEIARLNSSIKTEPRAAQQQLMKRMMGYLGIISYYSSSHAVQSNKFDEANKFLSIYRLAEPNNEEAWFLSAQLYAHNNFMQEAKQFLLTACQKGFNDNERIQGDDKLSPLIDDVDIKKILDSKK
jgi:predicted esterase